MTLQDLAGRISDGGRRHHDRPRCGRSYGGLLAALVGMLLLGGCSDEGDATASGTVDETITSTAATPAEQTTAPTPSATTAEEATTSTTAGTPVQETVTCEHPDGYAVTYPADWQTYPDESDPDLGDLACSIFGTAEMEVEPATSLPWVPIRVWIWDGLPFEIATQPEFRSSEAPSRDLESQDTTIAGRPAVRVVSLSEAASDTTPSDYYLPRGTETVSWIVDLSTDSTDRVLMAYAIPLATAFTGVTDADKSADGATSVDSTAEVLDAMMASLTLTD